jgi:hypothetical protein
MNGGAVYRFTRYWEAILPAVATTATAAAAAATATTTAFAVVATATTAAAEVATTAAAVTTTAAAITTAATATAATITATAAAEATATAAAGTALLALLGLVDAKRATIQRATIHSFDRLGGFLRSSHGYEREPARPAGLSVRDQVDVTDSSKFLERRADPFSIGVERKISNVQTSVHRLLDRSGPRDDCPAQEGASVLQSGGFITNVASTPTEQPDQNRRTVARPKLLLAVCVCHPESLLEFNHSEQQGFNLRNSRRIAVSIAHGDPQTLRSSSRRALDGRLRIFSSERSSHRGSGPTEPPAYRPGLRSARSISMRSKTAPSRGCAAVARRAPVAAIVTIADEYARGTCLSSSDRCCGACATATSERSVS